MDAGIEVGASPEQWLKMWESQKGFSHDHSQQTDPDTKKNTITGDHVKHKHKHGTVNDFNERAPF